MHILCTYLKFKLLLNSKVHAIFKKIIMTIYENPHIPSKD